MTCDRREIGVHSLKYRAQKLAGQLWKINTTYFLFKLALFWGYKNLHISYLRDDLFLIKGEITGQSTGGQL